MNFRKFIVVGTGSSGIAAALLIHKFSFSVFVSESGLIPENPKKTLIENKILFEESGHSDNIFDDSPTVILSPGISLATPIARLARLKNCVLWSEIELGIQFINKFYKQTIQFVGVTGTNGKSTVTNYCSQLLSRSQRKSYALGNIGTPLCQWLFEQNEHQLEEVDIVLELSSYQLELTESLKPEVSVFLNIQKDHLSRYVTLEEYFKAKWRMVMMTKSEGIVLLTPEVLKFAVKIGLPMPNCQILQIVFSEKNQLNHIFNSEFCGHFEYGIEKKLLPTPCYMYPNGLPGENDLLKNIATCPIFLSRDEKGGVICSFKYGARKEEWVVSDPCLPGAHNAINICMASVSAMALENIPTEIILAQWRQETTQYQHLPHRIEVIHSAFGKARKVIFINDSKATNCQSSLVAVKCFQNILLLLGGESKGEDFHELLPEMGQRIKMVFPFGAAGAELRNLLASKPSYVFEKSKNLKECLARAIEMASSGDVILLSPGCASFDEFQNYEHRGNQFKEYIALLEKKS